MRELKATDKITQKMTRDGAVAGREDAELVEHAVVRQEMLVVAHYDALIRTKSPTNCDAHLA